MELLDTTCRRREVLAGFGAALAGTVAGCVGAPAPGGRPESPTPAADEPFDEGTVEQARSVGVSLRESVVAIERADGVVAGSGWYVAAEDVVVTAAHVLDGSDDHTGWLPDGTELSLSPVGSAGEEGADVAAARADVTAPTLTVGSAEDLTPGQPLVQVGNPRDVGYWTVALGRFRTADPETDTFQSTLPGAGGFSGGPTATLDGDVVGLLAGIDPVHRRSFETVEPEPPTPYGPDDRLSHTRHEPAGVVTDLVEGWTR